MARHEFGIMERPPLPGERYDDYNPWDYAYVSIDDDWIEPLLPEWEKINFYWHTLDTPGKGVDYCGITLIPPESMEEMARVLPDHPEYVPLRELLNNAKSRGKFVIHFGI